MAVYSNSRINIIQSFPSYVYKGVPYGKVDIVVTESVSVNFPPRVRPAKYWLSPTAGNVYKHSHCPGYSTWQSANKQTTYFAQALAADQFAFLSGPASGLINQCDASLRAKLRSKSVSLAESIGEYDESVQLLYNAAKLIRDFWQLRRGRIPPRWAALTRQGLTRKWTFHDVSAAWIAKQFAIEPVISLLTDSIEQFTKPDEGILHLTLKSSRSEQYADSVGYIDHIRLRQTEYMVTHQLVCEYNSTIPDFQLGNPLEWVWAAIPFSFVVDWFFGVGNYFSQLNDTPANMKILTGTQITLRKSSVRALPIGNSYKGGAFREEFALSRSPNSSLSKPPLPSFHLVRQDQAPGLLATSLALLHLVSKR